MSFLRSRASNRPRAVQCFFCLSTALLPAQPQTSYRPSGRKDKGKSRAGHDGAAGTEWNWYCEACGCWNIKDKDGEMVSDIAAMHNSSLNSRSFSLRAKPSSSRLPSTSAAQASPFCHSCLANQTLIMNMLANYLPDDNDPSFPSLYANLPNYISSLHSRYPPVCPDCQPGVEAVLKKSDLKAQTEAWGSALQRGNAAVSSGTDDRGGRTRRVGWLEVLVWRVRGGLWCLGWVMSLGRAVIAIAALQGLDLDRTSIWQKLQLDGRSILLFHSLSTLWIAWDPYWLRRSSQAHHDRARSPARTSWIRHMLFILCLRLASSTYTCFTPSPTHTIIAPSADDTPTLFSRLFIPLVLSSLEMITLVHALLGLRVSQPIPLRLVRPVSSTSLSSPHTSGQNTPLHSSATATTSAMAIPPHPAFEGLTLDHDKAIRNPVFGRPSFGYNTQAQGTVPGEDDQADSMDWEPIVSTSKSYTPTGVAKQLDANADDDGYGYGYDDDDDDDDYGIRSHSRSRSHNWDTFGTGKQRMFPRKTEETGLENLLASWGITNPSEVTAPNGNHKHGRDQRGQGVEEKPSNCIIA